jgi:hypothetical protein
LADTTWRIARTRRLLPIAADGVVLPGRLSRAMISVAPRTRAVLGLDPSEAALEKSYSIRLRSTDESRIRCGWNQFRGGLIPRLYRSNFSAIRQGTTEPEKGKAVLDLSRNTFTRLSLRRPYQRSKGSDPRAHKSTRLLAEPTTRRRYHRERSVSSPFR